VRISARVPVPVACHLTGVSVPAWRCLAHG
jgi:hypothetical protein